MLNSGQNLSEGEKQIINFARLLLNKNVKIVILDEATANLDENYEDLFQNCIKNESEKIILAISHKLKHIENYDKVLVL